MHRYAVLIIVMLTFLFYNSRWGYGLHLDIKERIKLAMRGRR